MRLLLSRVSHPICHARFLRTRDEPPQRRAARRLLEVNPEYLYGVEPDDTSGDGDTLAARVALLSREMAELRARIAELEGAVACPEPALGA